MPNTVLKHFMGFMLVLFIASQACAAPGAPTVAALDPNSVDTAIAGTMAAASTQTGQVEALMRKPTLTVAPTKTHSPTPYPTFTIVAAAPLVRVTKNTNCRAGPGQVYNIVGALKAGEYAQAVGRSADGQWWIIHNPKHPDQLCWLSGKYATVTGIAGLLKVFTPPPTPKPTKTPKPPTRTPTLPPPTNVPPATSAPGTATATSTPTPSFTASYNGTTDTCGSEWWADFQFVNTGIVPFQSLFLILQDTTAGLDFTFGSDDFIDRNGCGQNTLDTLDPGASAIVSSPALNGPPPATGHAMHATLTLCSLPGQGGACVTQVVDFTAP